MKALRADYQKYLTRVRNELGFTHVRFHGILDDDMRFISIFLPIHNFFANMSNQLNFF